MKNVSGDGPADAAGAMARVDVGGRANWWRRRGSKRRGFIYRKPDGARVTDAAQIARIDSLAIPPAWKNVRINPRAGGSLQAVGVDGVGRVQYLYHPKFAARRQERKFARIGRFGEHLAALRRTTAEHLALDGFPREKVLALMLRLVNSLYIRVGTDASVRRYKTFGITTLGNRHLSVGPNGEAVFTFVGKHHIRHRKVLVDETLASLLAELKAIGAARRLFHYLDTAGKPRSVSPSELNAYLKSVTSVEFSVKDFRTWGGTLLAAVELAEIGCCEDERTRRKNVVKVVKRVAEQLGNTPAVCRASYIHPAVLKAYENGVTIREFTPRRRRRVGGCEPLEPEERALIEMFRNFEPQPPDSRQSNG